MNGRSLDFSGLLCWCRCPKFCSEADPFQDDAVFRMLLQIRLNHPSDLNWLNRTHSSSVLPNLSYHCLSGQPHPLPFPKVDGDRMRSGFVQQLLSMLNEVHVARSNNLTSLCIFWATTHCLPSCFDRFAGEPTSQDHDLIASHQPCSVCRTGFVPSITERGRSDNDLFADLLRVRWLNANSSR